MARDFTATITGSRGAQWERAVGQCTFFIRTPIPERVMIEGFSEPQLVYFFDLAEMPRETLERIAAYLKWKGGGEVEEIIRAAETIGLPIRAGDDVCIAIANPQRWF
ncbi:MAG TPA: hypothetical protein VHZ74_10605 [Bryobacteraceae bacterium]|jgi:hypothetical protein|nr:hypothetical protein [Bryobacteraceae bacterium]